MSLERVTLGSDRQFQPYFGIGKGKEGQIKLAEKGGIEVQNVLLNKGSLIEFLKPRCPGVKLSSGFFGFGSSDDEEVKRAWTTYIEMEQSKETASKVETLNPVQNETKPQLPLANIVNYMKHPRTGAVHIGGHAVYTIEGVYVIQSEKNFGEKNQEGKVGFTMDESGKITSVYIGNKLVTGEGYQEAVTLINTLIDKLKGEMLQEVKNKIEENFLTKFKYADEREKENIGVNFVMHVSIVLPDAELRKLYFAELKKKSKDLEINEKLTVFSSINKAFTEAVKTEEKEKKWDKPYAVAYQEFKDYFPDYFPKATIMI